MVYLHSADRACACYRRSGVGLMFFFGPDDEHGGIVPLGTAGDVLGAAVVPAGP